MNLNVLTSPEVRSAIEQDKALVALESTIISHGMPYPRNVETALRVERVVRENGAVPATVGIIDGAPTVGLSTDQIERLGKAGSSVVKVSRRDFPFVLVSGKDGATTVAGTMYLCARAGIRVFATGGIGGVHRGAERTFDISADLQELARTSVAVVCSGAKSILDLGLTLEYLETHGVPVIGYGTDELPAFYTRQSGHRLVYRLDTPEDVADVMTAKWELGLDGGVVIANPIPESDSMDPAVIDRAIEQALNECRDRRITQKEITPYLLGRIVELTGGASLDANIELVCNNAALAAGIAVAFAARGRSGA